MMTGMFCLVVAAFATGMLLSRFNALSLLIGSVLFSSGVIILGLMLHARFLDSLLLGLAAGLALQAGYLGRLIIGIGPRK